MPINATSTTALQPNTLSEIFFAHSKYSAYLCNEIWIDKMANNNSKLNIISMAEELFVAIERNAKLRYEGYKKLSEM